MQKTQMQLFNRYIIDGINKKIRLARKIRQHDMQQVSMVDSTISDKLGNMIFNQDRTKICSSQLIVWEQCPYFKLLLT